MKHFVSEQKLETIVEESQILFVSTERHIRIMRRTKLLVIFLTLLIVVLFYYSFQELKKTIETDISNFESSSQYSTESESEPEPPLKPGLLIDPTRRLTRKLPVSHVFITSAYYYPTSKS